MSLNVKVVTDIFKKERKKGEVCERTKKWEEKMRMRRQAILILSTFRDTGDREVQDEMALIRLITVIIRLSFAEFKGVSRDSMRPKKDEEEAKEEKTEKQEEGSYHDFLLKIRYSCLTKSLKGGMQTLPVRCDSLPCHVCALIRGQKEPSPWCTRVCATCICRVVNVARRNRSRLYRVR